MIVKLTINYRPVEAEAGQTVLDAARAIGITIPTLCYHKDLSPVGSCRLCMVEVEGVRGEVAACTLPVSAGMVVRTETPALAQTRKTILELLLRSYYDAGYAAEDRPETEFMHWVRHYGAQPPDGAQPRWRYKIDGDPNPFLWVDFNKCILCTRCVRACAEVQGRFVWGVAQRGFETRIVAGADTTMLKARCESCGACAAYCPTGALDDVMSLGLGRPDKKVVYAIWLPAYAVIYSGNGATEGSAPVDSSTYMQGQTVTVLGNSGGLGRPGYSLSGWNTQADGGGTTYTQGQTFSMGVAAVTLYAVWTALPTYTVTYNANNATSGTVPVDGASYWQGLSVTVLGNSGNLLRTGYLFSGWNTSANGSGSTYTQGQAFAMGSANVTLYALWIPVYTVTYSANNASGGTVPVDGNGYLQGQTVTVLGNSGTLTRTGYSFSGWNTAADGSGTIYTQGQTFQMSGGNATLYAAWVPLINTVAGGGSSDPGDGDPATSVRLKPTATASDSMGNLYIAEALSNRVRKVDTNGIITTVAGTGAQGYNGDNIAATSAQLYRPSGLAFDPADNLYISDKGNLRIRKVNTSGIITTVAGNGAQGYSGDGYAATSARLDQPAGIAFDAAGNLYIADEWNQCIRKVNTSGVITTVAGGNGGGSAGDGGSATSAQLTRPVAVAADSAGNYYIADTFNCRVRKVDTNGIITTVAGNGAFGFAGDGGPATSAQISEPDGVAVDSSGNLYIADLDNYRVRKVFTNGIIRTVAGDGTTVYNGENIPATSAGLYLVWGVAVDSADNLYVADQYRVRRTPPP